MLISEIFFWKNYQGSVFTLLCTPLIVTGVQFTFQKPVSYQIPNTFILVLYALISLAILLLIEGHQVGHVPPPLQPFFSGSSRLIIVLEYSPPPLNT